MKRILIASLAAGLLSIANGAKAEEFDVNCNTLISGEGVSSKLEGGGDGDKYHGKIQPGLAKRRALDKWEAIVAAYCPHHSSHWWRSKAKNFDCAIEANHEYCTATAVPGKKLLGWLLPD